jgi:hypothetical protein
MRRGGAVLVSAKVRNRRKEHLSTAIELLARESANACRLETISVVGES